MVWKTNLAFILSACSVNMCTLFTSVLNLRIRLHLMHMLMAEEEEEHITPYACCGEAQLLMHMYYK